MLKFSREHRPRQLLAIYVEPQRVEILQAHRHWRSWLIDTVEHFEIPQGESVYDSIQRLNLRPKNRKATSLLLFLPLTFYTFHREHYPAALEDQLQEAVNFDWQENIFLEHERTLHFSGPAIPVNHHLSVPIFSLQREIFEKFEQVLGAASFQSYRVIPSALMYRAFLDPDNRDPDWSDLEVFARLVDPTHLEVHRFYKGQLLDSLLLGKNREELRLFLEHLRSSELVSEDTASCLHLICTDGEAQKTQACQKLYDDEMQFDIHSLEGTLVSPWVSCLFNEDEVQTFDAKVSLKPWKPPRIAWLLLLVLSCYLSFALYQTHANRQLQENSRRLKREIAQLEMQWKPIEQLQTRIAKFQEDQKTLSEFNREGYPLFEILSVLSQSTPEDTWLNYFSIRKGQIVLRGDSKSAIKFLSELSKIEGFGDVKFASPVTRSPTSEDERFNVQFNLDGEKLKKAVEALQLDKQPESIEPEVPVPPEPKPKIMKGGPPSETEEEVGEPDEESSEDEGEVPE